MLKKQIVLILFLFSLFSVAQNTILISGKVVDSNTKQPLESATVYVTSAKDSSVVEYTITDKFGDFKLKIRKPLAAIYLKIAYMGYEDYTSAESQPTVDKDYGSIEISEGGTSLKEVVVKTQAPPVRIKKDTLEFNAASFKVRPDSNIETLLKQLPGVDFDNDGKITVNGKEVTQILINGKPFFDKDGKVAIQSLPSDIVEKIQVSDKKTKKEELSKEEASSDEASINVTIQKDKNKGSFGKFTGGYGTDDRYEASAIINYFKDTRRINILGSSNNINSTGFSMDDVFDNMGGARNAVRSTRVGAGITQSKLAGINYSEEFFKKFTPTGGYFYTETDNYNTNKTRKINFSPTGDITNESKTDTKKQNYGHNANFDFEYKINPTTNLTVRPNFVSGKSTNNTNSVQAARDVDGTLLNESIQLSNNESNNASFDNSINFNKAFAKKGRFLNLILNNNNSNQNSTNLNKSITNFYTGDTPNDNRNQTINKNSTNDNFSTRLDYTEPLTESFRFAVGTELERDKSVQNTNAYDYNADTADYTDANLLLSNYYNSVTSDAKMGGGFIVVKEKLNLDIIGGAVVSKMENKTTYLNIDNELNKEYINPEVRSSFKYKFSKTKSFRARYNYNTNLPSIVQLMPIENVSDPLNTVTGNPDLKPIETHSANIGLHNFNHADKKGYHVFMRGTYTDNQVVQTVTYKDNGQKLTTYQNISGNYSSDLGGGVMKSLKIEEHSFIFSAGASLNYNHTQGYTNSELYTANIFGVVPRVRFQYNYGEAFDISPGYSCSYNETHYTNYRIDATNNVVHNFSVQATNYFLDHFIFGNDFNYKYNSNITDGFRKDNYLWNTSLSYKFYKDYFAFKVKVYDMLNQNVSNSRTIAETSITDTENTVLKRYVMFTLSYKFGTFQTPKKQKGDGTKHGRPMRMR